MTGFFQNPGPEKGATVKAVRDWQSTLTCTEPPTGKTSIVNIDDYILQILLACGWQPAEHVSEGMVLNAKRIVDIDSQIHTNPNIQTYLKVEFLVRNARWEKGRWLDEKLFYPGHNPQFNSFAEQIGGEIINQIVGNLIPINKTIGLALDIAIASLDMGKNSKETKENIRFYIINKLKISNEYRLGKDHYEKLYAFRQSQLRFLMQENKIEFNYDSPQIKSLD